MKDRFDAKRLVKLGLLLTVVIFCYIFLQSWSQNSFQIKALTQMPTNLLIILLITDLIISAILGFIFAGIITNTHKRVLHYSWINFGKGLLAGIIWTLADIFMIGFGKDPRLSLLANTFSWSSLFDLVLGTLIFFILFSSKPKKSESELKNKQK